MCFCLAWWLLLPMIGLRQSSRALLVSTAHQALICIDWRVSADAAAATAAMGAAAY